MSQNNGNFLNPIVVLHWQARQPATLAQGIDISIPDFAIGLMLLVGVPGIGTQIEANLLCCLIPFVVAAIWWYKFKYKKPKNHFMHWLRYHCRFKNFGNTTLHRRISPLSKKPSPYILISPSKTKRTDPLTF